MSEKRPRATESENPWKLAGAKVYVWRDPRRLSPVQIADLEAHDRKIAKLEGRLPESESTGDEVPSG